MGHSDAFRSAYSEQDMHILQLEDPIEKIEVIMDTYGDEIKRLNYTYLKNTADTDDVTQEVFVTVYEKLHTFEGKSALRSWIYSIAINKCKDHLRSWQNRNQRLIEKLQTRGQTPKKQHTPEEKFIQQSESDELIQQILELPIKYREVIILFYFRDLSTKEISDVLQRKESTVRTRLSRGRKLLKQLLSTKRGATHG